MSVGRVEDGEASTERVPFADVLEATEEVHRSWEATDVHWANQWRSAPDATAFAATDRRILFATEGGQTSIGYNHVRAVETDTSDAMDLSVAFVVCGGLCLLVGLVVATDDPANGVGLVVLSLLLLVARNAGTDSTDRATVTVVIDNERQRLTFSADEEVGRELARLAGDANRGSRRPDSDAVDELPDPVA